MPEWKVILKRKKKEWEAGVFGPQKTEAEVRAHLKATQPDLEVISVERIDVPPVVEKS